MKEVDRRLLREGKSRTTSGSSSIDCSRCKISPAPGSGGPQVWQSPRSCSGSTRQVSPVGVGDGAALLLFRVKRAVVSSQVEPQSDELCMEIVESQNGPTFVVFVGSCFFFFLSSLNVSSSARLFQLPVLNQCWTCVCRRTSLHL